MVTPEEMIANLKVIAEKKMVENGGVDYVYELANTQGCRYAVDGQPSCIVGHLLVEHGIAAETFDVVESLRASEALNTLRVETYVKDHIWVALDDEFRSPAGQIADTVQHLQDHGTPWLQAVQEVESRYNGGEFS